MIPLLVSRYDAVASAVLDILFGYCWLLSSMKRRTEHCHDAPEASVVGNLQTFYCKLQQKLLTGIARCATILQGEGCRGLTESRRQVAQARHWEKGERPCLSEVSAGCYQAIWQLI
jgi:hypothetical protein